jgi:hypothetical protein
MKQRVCPLCTLPLGQRGQSPAVQLAPPVPGHSPPEIVHQDCKQALFRQMLRQLHGQKVNRG